QRVFERLVVARRQAVDEAEVDRDGEDLEATEPGADDHYALEIEAVGVKPYAAQQPGRIEPEAALRIGDAGSRSARDRPGGESIRHAAPRQHLAEKMGAAADDQVGAGLFAAAEKFRDLPRKVLAVGVERDHSVVSMLQGPGEPALQRRPLPAIVRVADDLRAGVPGGGR